MIFAMKKSNVESVLKIDKQAPTKKLEILACVRDALSFIPGHC